MIVGAQSVAGAKQQVIGLTNGFKLESRPMSKSIIAAGGHEQQSSPTNGQKWSQFGLLSGDATPKVRQSAATSAIKQQSIGMGSQNVEADFIIKRRASSLRCNSPNTSSNKCGKCQNHELEISKKGSEQVYEDNGNKCGKCQNHDFEVLKKGHARECPFKRCNCQRCRLLDARSDILQVISGKETTLKGTKKDPHCGFCQNHGVKILRKGHVRSCGFGQERHFRLDNCFDCEVHYIRNEVNRLQIKMRRAMKEDKMLSEEQRKAAREPISRDEVEKVCDMARIARLKREQIMLTSSGGGGGGGVTQQAASAHQDTTSSGASSERPIGADRDQASSCSPVGPPPQQQQEPNLEPNPISSQQFRFSQQLHDMAAFNERPAPKIEQDSRRKQTNCGSSSANSSARSAPTRCTGPIRNKLSTSSSSKSTNKSNSNRTQLHDPFKTTTSRGDAGGSCEILLRTADDQLAGRGQVWRPWSQQQVAAMQQTNGAIQFNSFLADQLSQQQNQQAQSFEHKQNIINLWNPYQTQLQHPQYSHPFATNDHQPQLQQQLHQHNQQQQASPPSSPVSNTNSNQMTQHQQQRIPLVSELQHSPDSNNLLLAATMAANIQQAAQQHQKNDQPRDNLQANGQQLELANDQRNLQEQFNGMIGLILAQIAQLKNRSPNEQYNN